MDTHPPHDSTVKNQLIDSVGTPLCENVGVKAFVLRFGMIVLALFIGFIVGMAVWALLQVSSALTHGIWNTLRAKFDIWFFPLIICPLGGLVMGLWNKHFDSAPRPLEEVMHQIKMEGSYHVKGIIPSIVSFLMPLAFGGSVGPEAGLSGLISAACYSISTMLKKAGIVAKEMIEISIPATLSAIFGTPFAGLAAAVNEDTESAKQAINGHCQSIEDYTFKTTTKAVLYLTAALGAFGGIQAFTALFDVGAGLPRFDSITSTGWNWIYFIPCLFLGYLQALVFHAAGKGSNLLSQRLMSFSVIKPVMCGVVLGITALYLPNVLFSGESQSHELMTTWTTLGATTLLATGFLKAAITPFCLNMGWNGGNFFPCIFAGTACGYGFSMLCSADPLFCVVVVTSTFLSASIKKPLMTIGILLLCFPIQSVLWMGLASILAAALPWPQALSKSVD